MNFTNRLPGAGFSDKSTSSCISSTLQSYQFLYMNTTDKSISWFQSYSALNHHLIYLNLKWFYNHEKWKK